MSLLWPNYTSLWNHVQLFFRLPQSVNFANTALFRATFLYPSACSYQWSHALYPDLHSILAHSQILREYGGETSLRYVVERLPKQTVSHPRATATRSWNATTRSRLGHINLFGNQFYVNQLLNNLSEFRALLCATAEPLRSPTSLFGSYKPSIRLLCSNSMCFPLFI